jgi:SAM-dependent methyltransferase
LNRTAVYTENAPRDALRLAKASASNLLARFAPAAYVRLTQQTGRGSGEDDAADIARYFQRSFDDYRHWLVRGGKTAVEGLKVLEYGPGDILGTALLFHAHGAAEVECVDRFPLQQVSPFNAAVYRALIDSLSGAQRQRAESAFVRPGQPESGLRPEAVRYRITPDGLAARPAAFDAVLSRAVLEHVNALEATLADIESGLRPGGLGVHNVDLRSHNLDRYRPFDFLTWPEWQYRLMYSHKGFPNRWRPDAYRRWLAQSSLHTVALEATGRIGAADVARIRPHLPDHLSQASDDELAWTGFWMVLAKPERAG